MVPLRQGTKALSSAATGTPARRVLIVSQLPPPYGGLTVHTARLRAALLRAGHEVEVLAPPTAPHPPGTRFRLLRTVRNQLSFLTRIARTRCDLVHDHVSTYAIGAPGLRTGALHVALLLALRASRRPWIVSSGNGLLPGILARTSGWHRALERALYAPVRFAIAKNQPLLEAFAALGLADRSRIVGTFLDPLPAPGGERLAPEIEKFLFEHPRCLVTAGFRFEPLYHLGDVVRATAAARSRCAPGEPEIGVVVLASQAEDPVGKPAFDRAVTETGIAAHVLVLRDVDHALAVMARTALFVRFTDFDGDANTVKEAMWVGVPVLATDLPNRPPGIELVPKGDFDSLVASLHRMLDAPDPARDERNRAWVREDIARNTAAILGLYEEAVG